MKEDKRIIKTKRELKRAIVALLKEKPFEQISVKEICESSSTSRITFYTHYRDKYDLLNSVFEDFTERARLSCAELFDFGRSRADVTAFLKELLHGVIGCIYENKFLLEAVDSEKNSYLAFAFKDYVTESVDRVLELIAEKFECKYTSAEASAFVRGGFVSLFSAAVRAGDSPEALERKAGKLIEDLVRSDILFLH